MKKTLLYLLTLCVLAGCTSATTTTVESASAAAEETIVVSSTATPEPTPSPTAETERAVDSDVYAEYKDAYNHQGQRSSYTAGVICEYERTYDGSSKENFRMDGVLQLGNIQKSPIGHYTQNIESSDMQFSLSGDYYNGVLYNTYNGVNYYEEHTLEQLKEVMLVPLDGVLVAEEDLVDLQTSVEGDETTYVLTLSEDAAKTYFLDRYDFSGMSEYDGVEVPDGKITQVFNTDGYLVNEQADFTASVEVDGVSVLVNYHSEAGFLQINETEVEIDDETKQEESEYVSFLNIDTDAISDVDLADDTEEATVTETFKKRLVNRLNYEIDDDGLYSTTFNDTEKYTIDFANKQFSYAHNGLRYVYNWGGDTGSFQTSCNYDYKTQNGSTGCDDSVIETLEEVKLYFQMELYYCGLSLEDLQKE